MRIDLPAVCRLGVLAALAGGLLAAAVSAQTTPGGEVDTALIVSVDVSNSVDERRYKLQMDGIASALEDPGVIDAILSGPQGGILFAMVSWADRPTLVVPWQRIASREEAMAVAAQVRRLPQQGGEFTCLTQMLRTVSDKIVPQVPVRATRVVLDVSGDGSDNCNAQEPTGAVRDELVSYGVTINGLPILEGEEAETLEGWYDENVKGGPGGFILPAAGFEDFGRAIRRKFVIEISARPASGSDDRASGPSAAGHIR